MLRLFKPDGYYRALTAIPIAEFLKRDISGVLFDLDNTITTWNNLVCDESVIAWFRQLHEAGIKSCILSNNHAPRIEPVAKILGSFFVAEAHKPSAQGYYRGMQVLGTTEANTMMVGDQLLTDIYGAKKVGIACFLVVPIDTRQEYWFTTLVNRRLERLLLRRLKLVAK